MSEEVWVLGEAAVTGSVWVLRFLHMLTWKPIERHDLESLVESSDTTAESPFFSDER